MGGAEDPILAQHPERFVCPQMLPSPRPPRRRPAQRGSRRHHTQAALSGMGWCSRQVSPLVGARPTQGTIPGQVPGAASCLQLPLWSPPCRDRRLCRPPVPTPRLTETGFPPGGLWQGRRDGNNGHISGGRRDLSSPHPICVCPQRECAGDTRAQCWGLSTRDHAAISGERKGGHRKGPCTLPALRTATGPAVVT